MSVPLVSIIVPVYNVNKYINDCLHSLCKQSLKNIEIIVVDDCGNDDSMDKVRDFAAKDERIKVIYNEKNLGLAESRNIGLKYVRGKYVAFCDSDDWVSLDFYEKLYNAIERENADIAVGNVIYFYDEHKQTEGWVGCNNFKLGKDVIVEQKDKQYNIYACACWNKLYRMDLFRMYGIKFPKGLYVEDVPVTFITTMLANKLVLVKDAVYFYRQRANSIMAMSKFDRKPFDIFQIYDYTENLCENIKVLIENKISSIYYKILKFLIFTVGIRQLHLCINLNLKRK